MAGTGCQTHAGVLTENEGKIKSKAKTKFIKDCKDELRYGTDNLPTPPLFPCGPSVPPNPYAEMLQLEDEKKFPDFHKNIVGAYEKIARLLDLTSDFKFLPICCPISLGFKLGVNISIKNFPIGFVPYTIPNLPLLALKMKALPPIKLAAKFPTIPTIPPPIPIPEFPTFDPKLLVDLYAFNISFITGIPKLLANLALKIPTLALKFPSLPELFKGVCEIAFDSNVFGNIQTNSIVEITAVKVLTKRVVECSMIAAVGTTLGSSPGGITGGMGRYLGYEPPGDETEEEIISTRDQIMSYASECAGLFWGKDSDVYAQHILYTEYGDGERHDLNSAAPDYDPRVLGKLYAIQKCSEASSCGMFVRACYFAAGASYIFEYEGQPLLSKVKTKDPSVPLYYDFFLDEYRLVGTGGVAIAGIIQAAQKKGALIDIPKGDLPALKRGDCIMVHNPDVGNTTHAILVAEDYIPGSLHLVTIEGGAQDPDNHNKPTGIRNKTYGDASQFKTGHKFDEEPFGMIVELGSNDVVIQGRKILALIDGEILCTSPVGTNMSQPDSTLNSSVGTDSNDDRNNHQFIGSHY